ncbi:MAG: hypothetical protein HY315_07825 [Acidobacteria bacterium]|nr:hypothetical protein [Acidobacteriota bacterium]
MNVKKLLLATIVGGIVANALDFVVHEQILAGYYSSLPSLFRQDTPVAWLVFGDFVAVLVLVWVYDRVYSSFGGGVTAGATYGLYAGILVNFPTWIFANLLFVGFPYALGWIWVVYGIIWAVITGAIAGALYKK